MAQVLEERLVPHGTQEAVVFGEKQKHIFPLKKLGAIGIKGTNYTFKVLITEEELHTAFGLRYEVFCIEKGIADPLNYPNQRETDEYDSNSLHVGVFEDDEMIAYARLVLPCEKFPIERSNSLPDCFNRERTIESSRGLVIKDKKT